MKIANVFLLGMVLTSFVLFTGCSGVQTIDTSGIKEVTITSANLASEHVDLVRNVQAGKDVIFKVPAGQTLPLQINIDMPMIKTVGVPNEIRFKRDTYFYISKNRMLISPDGTSWAPIQDLDSLKKLYGWSRGTLAIGLSASKKHNVRLEMSLIAQ